MLVDRTEHEVFRHGWPNGWSVQLIEHPQGHSELYLLFQVGDEVDTSWRRLAWRSQGNSQEEVGKRIRAQHLLEAAARYMNAGGTADEMQGMLIELGLDLPTLEPPGFYLLNSEQPVDYAQHAFISRDEQHIVLWEEGASVELITATEFNSRLDQEEDELDDDGDDDEFGDGVVK